ncbi:MAG: hypothetical protein ACR2QA_09365 [Solirubrobacteraceae bacterium]
MGFKYVIRLVVVAVAAGALIMASASTGLPLPAGAPVPPPLPITAPAPPPLGPGARPTAANARAARADARHLLARLVLPAGARRSALDPAPDRLLAHPFSHPRTPVLVDRHAFFRVPGTPGNVLAWIVAHRPAGSTLSGRGMVIIDAAMYRGGGSSSVTFSFPAVRGVLASRAVLVEVTDSGRGDTALRADAEVVWFVPRPASERIPRGVRSVTITMPVAGRGPGARGLARTITAPAKIRRIVALVDRLAPRQPGLYTCPAAGSSVGLIFRGHQRGTPLARANAEAGGCDGVVLRIRGRPAPPLIGARKLIAALGAL